MTAPNIRRVVHPARAAMVAIACSVALAPLAARAQDAPDKYSKQDWDKAKALFSRGVALMKEGNYERGCGKLAESLEVVPGIGTHGKLAECYEKLGRTASAWRLYRELVALAREKRDRKLERIARKRARKLEPQLAYLTIEASNLASIDLAAIADNGQEVPVAEWGKARAVDPGAHLISAYARDHEPWEVQVRVEPAEARTVTVPKLQAAAPPKPVDTAAEPDDADEPEPRRPRISRAPPEQQPKPAVPKAETDRRRDGGSAGLRVTGLVLLGLGTASLGAGGYFGWEARADWNEAQANCEVMGDVAQCDSQADADLVKRARSRAFLSTVTAGAGAAVALVGVILWLTGRGDGSEPAAGAASLRVTPAVSPEAAGVFVYGQF